MNLYPLFYAFINFVVLRILSDCLLLFNVILLSGAMKQNRFYGILIVKLKKKTVKLIDYILFLLLWLFLKYFQNKRLFSLNWEVFNIMFLYNYFWMLCLWLIFGFEFWTWLASIYFIFLFIIANNKISI